MDFCDVGLFLVFVFFSNELSTKFNSAAGYDERVQLSISNVPTGYEW